MLSIGASVRLARHRAGLTQEELARQIGVTPSDLVRLERGLLSDPEPQLLRHIAHALDLDPLWFLRDDTAADNGDWA